MSKHDDYVSVNEYTSACPTPPMRPMVSIGQARDILAQGGLVPCELIPEHELWAAWSEKQEREGRDDWMTEALRAEDDE